MVCGRPVCRPQGRVAGFPLGPVTARVDAMTVTRPTTTQKATVRSPADLIAAVPYLLGFHPSDSVVVLAFRDRRLEFAARHDLPARRERAGSLARHLVTVVARQGLRRLAVVCYGTAFAADPMSRAVVAAAEQRGLTVLDALRVADGRWWSYTCADAGCCPPEGTPFDPATSTVAAAFAYAGLAPMADREALAAQLAPVSGPDRVAMTQATDRAGERFLAEFGSLPDDGDRGQAVFAAGEAAVRAAIQRYAEGGRLDDDEVAWLSVLLLSVPVRDVAWQAITSVQPHLDLWRDVTRRCDPELVAAPASLLGFTAWRAGDGTLAGLAVERALAEEPSYSMARLLLDGLRQGIPPSALDGWGESL